MKDKVPCTYHINGCSMLVHALNIMDANVDGATQQGRDLNVRVLACASCVL